MNNLFQGFADRQYPEIAFLFHRKNILSINKDYNRQAIKGQKKIDNSILKILQFLMQFLLNHNSSNSHKYFAKLPGKIFIFIWLFLSPEYHGNNGKPISYCSSFPWKKYIITQHDTIVSIISFGSRVELFGFAVWYRFSDPYYIRIHYFKKLDQILIIASKTTHIS